MVSLVFSSPLSPARFCHSCLQECLRPQKPVCAVCRAGLGHWTKAAELELKIQSSVAACKGCGAQVRLSQMRSHTAACSKFQEYIEEGVRTTAQSQPAIISPVPNRFTFTCPYCSCQNLDQDGLVEHCTSQHTRDARQVDYATDEHTMIQEALQRSLLDN
ncbi:E3 ubiquitin-protein ligase RNF114 [Liparis tanakae]|uniref:RING-type E3 ubiquitin transferase n=1 Tax=Liparis tanakae TaxID=230148 RepID=A0A4Z2FVI7_9TELE|nr:E3 ubiquitin-protein ligase RNF114 [Liparis tanakae]